jgi:hypothetical protein
MIRKIAAPQTQNQEKTRFDSRHLIINLIIGIFEIIWAIKEQWPASQIIWQFWTSSLLFGTMFFIAAIIIKGKTEINGKTLVIGAILLGIIFIVPILFFHSLYALFLNHLFPILDWDPMGKHVSLIAVFTWEALIKCITTYWVFLLGMFFSKINDLVRLNKTGNVNIMMDPFKSVIQMHVLIIIFGLFSSLKLSSNSLYLLLIFGFFQISDLYQLIKNRFPKKTKQASDISSQ